MRDVFKRYPISEFERDYPARSEQYYWALVWGAEWERLGGESGICLDDLNELFQSNMGFMDLSRTASGGEAPDPHFMAVADSFSAPPRENTKQELVEFDFSKEPGQRVLWRPAGTHPVILHWNGFFKTNYWRTFVELTSLH